MSGTVKSLFISPEYLEGLSFSATLGEAQKLKVEFEFCIISLAKQDDSWGLGSPSPIFKKRKIYIDVIHIYLC